MKAKVYIAPTKYAYRAAKDGQSIQFLDTTMNLGWKHSDYMTGKVLKAARPAQEVLDEEAARRDWQPWEEPEESAAPQSNAVQLAAILADRYKRSGGEMTAEKFKKFLGTGGYGDPDLGDIEYDYKGVSIRPEPQRWTREMKFTWAKFIKFCRENGLLEEESIKCNTKLAQKPAAAANMATPAAPPQAKTSTTSESTEAESSNLEPPPSSGTAIMSAPASPADAGAATQSLSAAAPASLEVQPLASSAFDFGADAETNAMLLQDAQIFMAGSMARVMAAKRAHDRTAHNYRGSWGKWCELVGISRDTGDNMVRVAEQFGNIQVDGHNLIDLQPMKLLYAASRPSTPPEVRAKVESLEITSSKQFQELLDQLKAKDQELAAERADREAERTSTSALLAYEQHRRQEALRARLEAEKAAREIKNELAGVKRKEALARRRAEEAEKITKEAQKNAMFQIQQAQDAENQRAMMAERERFHLSKIAELEARPVEVVGADPDEIERRAQVLADQKTAQIQAELAKVRTEQKASDNQSDQRAVYDAVILAAQAMDAAWRSLIPVLTRLGPVEKRETVYQFVNQLMCMKEEALQMIEKEKKLDADHQN